MDTTNNDRVRSLMAELIIALPGFNPLEIPKEGSEAEKRFALANMYKEKGFREYMTRTIFNNVGNLQSVNDLYGLAVQQGRISALKELFSLSKQMFHEAEKIEKAIKDE